MRNVMNKACYHGDLTLVKYLVKNYSAEIFDYKIALIKACNNSQRVTVDVCEWLWKNIDRNLFDMNAALNYASRCDNYDVVQWMLTYVDIGLFNLEDALLSACEHCEEFTVKLLLYRNGIKTLDFQSAIIRACQNKEFGLRIIKVLCERADESRLNINAVFLTARQCYRTDIAEWTIKTYAQNLTYVTETSRENNNFNKSPTRNLLDINHAITSIFNMDAPKQTKKDIEKSKLILLCLVHKQTDKKTLVISKLFTESSEKDWLDIFKWIIREIDHVVYSSTYIRNAVNVASQHGAFNIVKWSLTNIDAKLIDIDKVMIESCAYGWLECLVLIQKHCNQYVFDVQAAMDQACTYGWSHIAEWLLKNCNLQCFNCLLLLGEAGRNGWIDVFRLLVTKYNFHISDIHIATRQALEKGQLKIAKWILSKVGRKCFDFSSFSDNTYSDASKEGVATFVLHNADLRHIDVATIMINACIFGWKDVADFIIKNDVRCLCDYTLAFNTACDNGEIDIVNLLLEKFDHQILTVDKAMHSVAVRGWEEIAILLLDKFEPTRLDIGNVLIEACRHGEIDVVQVIFRKVEHKFLDVKTALKEAIKNHMHEDLVLWILHNIDQEHLDLKAVRRNAIQHKWRQVQLATIDDTDDLNQVDRKTETDCIIIS